MPRNYQLKKNNDYYMPHDLYMRVQYIIKGYDRLKREYINIAHSYPSPSLSGMPRGTMVGNPTLDKVTKLESISGELHTIEQSIVEMRGLYSNRVQEDIDIIKAYWSYDYFNYIHTRNGLEDIGPSRRTWNYFKVLLSQKIAQKLKLF